MEQYKAKQTARQWLLLLATLTALLLLGIAAAQVIVAQEPDAATPAEAENIAVTVDALLPLSVVEGVLETAVSNSTISQEAADIILADIEVAMPNVTTEFFAKPIDDFDFSLIEPKFDFFPFGLFDDAQADGTLTEEEVQAILEDFAQLAGDSVTITFGDGLSELSIASEGVDLEAALLQAIDNAVSNNMLTAEEAATLTEKIEEKGFYFLPQAEKLLSEFPIDGVLSEELASGEIIVNGLQFPDGVLEFHEGIDGQFMETIIMKDGWLNTLAGIEAGLETAVSEGRITAEEKAAIVDALAPLFDEE